MRMPREYDPVRFFTVVAAVAGVAAFIIEAYVLATYVMGVWHLGWALFGVMIGILAVLCMTTAFLAMMLNRMEARIVQVLSELERRREEP